MNDILLNKAEIIERCLSRINEARIQLASATGGLIPKNI